MGRDRSTPKCYLLKLNRKPFGCFCCGAWFGCEDNLEVDMLKHVQTCSDMFRHVQTCSGHYLSYLLVFLFKSISKIWVMQERETLNECFVVLHLVMIYFLYST